MDVAAAAGAAGPRLGDQDGILILPRRHDLGRLHRRGRPGGAQHDDARRPEGAADTDGDPGQDPHQMAHLAAVLHTRLVFYTLVQFVVFTKPWVGSAPWRPLLMSSVRMKL